MSKLFCWYRSVPEDQEIDTYYQTLEETSPVSSYTIGQQPAILNGNLYLESELEPFIVLFCSGLATCIRKILGSDDLIVDYIRKSDNYDIYLYVGSQSKLSWERVLEDLKIIRERDNAWRRTLSQREASDYGSAEEDLPVPRL